MTDSLGPGGGGRARPSSVGEAIERIAKCHHLPKEAIQWEFWNAWDALLTDADRMSCSFPTLERISQLAACRYVVLLSEPGMGKSIVLEQQARAAGGCFTASAARTWITTRVQATLMCNGKKRSERTVSFAFSPDGTLLEEKESVLTSGGEEVRDRVYPKD